MLRGPFIPFLWSRVEFPDMIEPVTGTEEPKCKFKKTQRERERERERERARERERDVVPVWVEACCIVTRCRAALGLGLRGQKQNCLQVDSVFGLPSECRRISLSKVRSGQATVPPFQSATCRFAFNQMCLKPGRAWSIRSLVSKAVHCILVRNVLSILKKRMGAAECVTQTWCLSLSQSQHDGSFKHVCGGQSFAILANIICEVGGVEAGACKRLLFLYFTVACKCSSPTIQAACCLRGPIHEDAGLSAEKGSRSVFVSVGQVLRPRGLASIESLIRPPLRGER